eukprot:TRINITY_DN5321_c0_g1_i3.p1 TRINITY_DN5321_c0_g1~~TRINITY_DN5321_c0_g1_i3.p1  ORF type:complete len:428 (+),score=67.44 TRINITY_DN5321_c0_g1_i3:7-1290(+)
MAEVPLDTKDENDGFLATPQEADRYHKWKDYRSRTLAISSCCTLLTPLAGTMYMPSLDEIISTLDTTEEMLALTISIFMIISALMPMFWGPFIDRFGRKKTMIFNLTLIIGSFILAGMSQTILWLILARSLQAVAASAIGTIGGAIIADTYPPKIRGDALGIYAMILLLGTVIGPILGGYIAVWLNWRWIFYLVAGISALDLLVVILFLRETLDDSLQKRSMNPLNSLKLFLIPGIGWSCLLIGSIFGAVITMLFTMSLDLSRDPYNYSENTIGLMMMPYGVGLVIGNWVGGKFADLGYKHRGGGGRLVSAILTALFAAFSYAGYGFSITTGSVVGIIICTILAGFCSTGGRPGLVAFCIERGGTSAGAVVGCVMTAQFSSGFVYITLAPLILDHISTFVMFLSCSMIILVTIPPILVVTSMFWGKD